MKKHLLALLALILVASMALPIIGFAEDGQEVTQEETLISFRGIPWYSARSEAESILTEEGEYDKYRADNDIYRMSAIKYTNVTSGSDRVDGGGINAYYRGLTVAGYSPIETYACYIYTLNDDGSINRLEEDAEFYFGYYFFRANEFSDYQAIYDDLGAKITSLYGDGVGNADKFHTTTTWTDSEDNQIMLLINEDRTYVTLGYMAAGADERMDAMQAALDAEALAEENAEREKNKENVSGL